MFSYKCKGECEKEIRTAEEVLSIVANEPYLYSITDIVKVLKEVTSNYQCQVIFRDFGDIYIEFSNKEYIQTGIDEKDLVHILPYINQVQVSDCNMDTTIFSAPNLEVIAFCNIKHDEYLDVGLHVVFGKDIFPSLLDKLPSMNKVTITRKINPQFIPDIIAMLPKWQDLSCFYIDPGYKFQKKEFDLLRSFIKSHGVYTDYADLEYESAISFDLRGSPIWTILSFDKLPTELRRELLQMIGLDKL